MPAPVFEVLTEPYNERTPAQEADGSLHLGIPDKYPQKSDGAVLFYNRIVFQFLHPNTVYTDAAHRLLFCT